MTAAEAIQALRSMRPGSIETKEQEEAVSKYCSLLWKRRGVFSPGPAQQMPSRPEITGKPIETTDLLVLCGIPGSGKSSFRQVLAKRIMASRAAPITVRSSNTLYQPWTEIHSDEIGRKGCERISLLLGVSTPPQLSSTYLQNFCEARALQRVDHPTLPPGRRVGFAIHQHSSTFEFPKLDEGFLTIVRITSVEAALELVDLLSPPLSLLKFPRTQHLIDLGAATSDDLISDFNSISLPVDENTTIVIVDKNRSHAINSKSHRQFRDLDSFLKSHRAVLYEILHRDPLFPGRFILYGE
ncbi:hypothetical protein PI125_g13979 [Phytophthora idaei]|nr:hypothetical protein PI125_g13979 [Phytophthora idaei]